MLTRRRRRRIRTLAFEDDDDDIDVGDVDLVADADELTQKKVLHDKTLHEKVEGENEYLADEFFDALTIDLFESNV